MSTRATIRIIEKDKDGEVVLGKVHREVWLYHHSDGYPKYVGKILREYLKSKFSIESANEVATDIIRIKDGDKFDGFELTTRQHGDVDYTYVITIEKERFRNTATLKCYKTDWSKLKFTGDFRKDTEDFVSTFETPENLIDLDKEIDE